MSKRVANSRSKTKARRGEVMTKLVIQDFNCPNGCGRATEHRTGIGRFRVVGYSCSKCLYQWRPYSKIPPQDWTPDRTYSAQYAASCGY
jgi:predicted RNA-binding Zn-ribbon protein involved in translation (DUF1610 family)